MITTNDGALADVEILCVTTVLQSPKSSHRGPRPIFCRVQPTWLNYRMTDAVQSVCSAKN